MKRSQRRRRLGGQRQPAALSQRKTEPEPSTWTCRRRSEDSSTGAARTTVQEPAWVYGSRLKGLAAELGAHELGAVTREQLDGWLAKANRFPDGRPKAPDTIRAYAIAFKALQAWALEYGHLRLPIATKIKKPMGRLREKLPTPAQTAQLLEHASAEFRLIYEALRRTGARPSELCRATIADWRLDEEAIVLQEHKTAEKTGRPREIPVGSKVAQLLRQAIGDRTEGPIFLSPRGKPWSANYLSKIYRQLRDAAGLPKHLVLYLARHEHGTAMYEKFDLKAAADALGHKNMNTTTRYVHTSKQRRAANQDAVLDLEPPAG
jgi:integrase